MSMLEQSVGSQSSSMVSTVCRCLSDLRLRLRHPSCRCGSAIGRVSSPPIPRSWFWSLTSWAR